MIKWTRFKKNSSRQVFQFMLRCNPSQLKWTVSIYISLFDTTEIFFCFVSSSFFLEERKALESVSKEASDLCGSLLCLSLMASFHRCVILSPLRKFLFQNRYNKFGIWFKIIFFVALLCLVLIIRIQHFESKKLNVNHFYSNYKRIDVLMFCLTHPMHWFQ